MAEVFLNIGRARTGQNNALCSMPELIAGLKESWKQKAENKGLKLSVELKNAPKQTFNEVLGATIFDNLVFNSIHYTDKGSVTVIIDEDKAIIRDTGIGIKEEDREKVLTEVLEPDRAVAAIIKDLGWDWQFRSAQPRP